VNAIEHAATHELRITPVGSRVTCVPPPVGTDQDYLMFVDAGVQRFDVIIALLLDDWNHGGSCEPGEEGDGWATFRKDDENIILTWDLDFHDSFLAASAGAKALNLLNKEERIILFQAVQGSFMGRHKRHA
jgi:hypothetical protein